jgi:hypothetical protein
LLLEERKSEGQEAIGIKKGADFSSTPFLIIGK